MDLLPKFIDDAAGPPAQAVGNTLANIWELAIGSHVSLWMKKQEIRQQQNLQDYIKRVEEKTQEIPEEHLTEPQMHIVGPAIEASKYYIDSEELREMFANLIASSIDDRKIEKTHPSFVEIIKQMSALDAQILANFKSGGRAPIIELRFAQSNNVFVVHQSHIMDFKSSEQYKLKSSSISNLQRLGLLKIDYSMHTVNDDAYSFIHSHPAFISAQEELIKIRSINPLFERVHIQRGLTSITPICENFIEVCL